MISSSHDIWRAIGEGRGPSRWLVALGYAGWSPGQLEEELVRHGWHVTPGSDGLLFETPPAKRWQAAFAEAGVDACMQKTEGGEATSPIVDIRAAGRVKPSLPAPVAGCTEERRRGQGGVGRGQSWGGVKNVQK